jgi:hypothetical protein
MRLVVPVPLWLALPIYLVVLAVEGAVLLGRVIGR